MRHYSFGDVLKNSFKIWEKMVKSIKKSLVTVPERHFKIWEKMVTSIKSSFVTVVKSIKKV